MIDRSARAIWNARKASDPALGDKWETELSIFRDSITEEAEAALNAAGVAPQEPQPGKRIDPEFRAQLVDIAKGSIQDVWDDVPGGVDAETLAQNVVGSQEFAWISRGFPVAPQEPSEWEHRVIGGEDLLARLMDTLAYYHCRSVNPKADSPRFGYHAMSEDQREFLRERQREAAEEVLRMWQSEDRHAPSPDREKLIARLTGSVNPLTTTCGECGSKPGKRCYGNGEMRRPHPSREAKAERELMIEAADALATPRNITWWTRR